MYPRQMNPLEAEIRRRIAVDGPMPVADYMRLCLTHPEHGYYTANNPIGGRASADRSGGDFITAPEVSQMFGEMVGVWVMEVWQALGSPSPFALVEIGPGRGTLMADLLRVSRAMPGFREAMDLHLVEISPVLAEQQSLALGKMGAKATWLSDVAGLPDMPTVVIANEVLDALPVNQMVWHDDAWHQRVVGLVGNEGSQRLGFTVRNGEDDRPKAASQSAKTHSLDPNTVLETAVEAEKLVASLAERLTRQTGAALFIDYGSLQPGFGDTLQAVRNHAYADPLTDPGKADLSVHVNFAPLVAIAQNAGCAVPAPVTQGEFLLALGLLERAGNLGADKPQHVREQLTASVERLAGESGMGSLFKAFAFGAPASLGNRWPGFG